MIEHLIELIISVDQQLNSGIAADLSVSELRHVFIECCLKQSGSTRSAFLERSTEKISVSTSRDIANALPMTSGAREQMSSSVRVDEVFRIMLGDKIFRTELRTVAQHRKVPHLASAVIKQATSLGEAKPDKRIIRIAPRFGSRIVFSSRSTQLDSGDSNQRDNSSATIEATQTAAFRDHAYLNSRLKLTLPLRRGARTALTLDETITKLGGDREVDSRVVSFLRAIPSSDERLILPLLYRQLTRGDWAVAGIYKDTFLMECVRVYTSLNANETARRILRDIVAGTSIDALVASDDEESTRIVQYFARSCLRTGRVDEARALYKKLFYYKIHDHRFLLDYFNSVFQSDAEIAEGLIDIVLHNNYALSAQDYLALAEYLLVSRQDGKAIACIQRAIVAGAAKSAVSNGEAYITLANLALERGDRGLWYDMLRVYGRANGVDLPQLANDEPTGPFRFARPIERRAMAPVPEPDISVVMTSFNAGATLERAVRSVLSQTVESLEIIISDDASTDDTVAVIKKLIKLDKRIRAFANTRNVGTYAAKNLALEAARGRLVTFHDSDDWMHPERLARQSAALDDATVCTTSNWIRMDSDGHVFQRRGGGYAHLNPASTMFRRSLVDELGSFDFVRTGADSELLTRIRMRFGWERVKALPECLSIGLHHEASLTQSGVTAFDEHRYSKVRQDYTEAWLESHLSRLEAGHPVELRSKVQRPFAAPDAIRVDLSGNEFSEIKGGRTVRRARRS